MSNFKESFFKLDILTGTWDLGSFLENSATTLGDWSKLFLMLLGLVAVVWSVVQIVTGLMSAGKKQTNWLVSGLLLIVGGVLSASTGYDLVKTIASGGRKTIEDLGGGAIILFEYSKFYFFK